MMYSISYIKAIVYVRTVCVTKDFIILWHFIVMCRRRFCGSRYSIR